MVMRGSTELLLPPGRMYNAVQAEEEYDVIPNKKPAKVATPTDSPKVARGVPQRASYAGNQRPPSANTGRTGGAGRSSALLHGCLTGCCLHARDAWC